MHIWPLGGYLAEAVDDDECGSQEVAVRGVFPHDVFVPQLDGHQGPKQLAQLLDQQVEFALYRRWKVHAILIEIAFKVSICSRCEIHNGVGAVNKGTFSSLTQVWPHTCSLQRKYFDALTECPKNQWVLHSFWALFYLVKSSAVLKA